MMLIINCFDVDVEALCACFDGAVYGFIDVGWDCAC